MHYQSFILKYTEIALKGKNRAFFERALVESVRRQLATVDGTFTVSHVSGRLYVAGKDFDFDDTVAAMQRVFGVTSICPCRTIAKRDEGGLPSIDEIAEVCVHFMGNVYGLRKRENSENVIDTNSALKKSVTTINGQTKDINTPDTVEAGRDSIKYTFKVKCRRVDKSYPLDSMETSAYIGGKLLDAYPELKVDVHDPEIMLHIELREQVNIYSKEMKGPGGMPTGTSGKAMLLLSGGIDSPVAGYLVAKRGVEIDAVYFHAPPYTSERAKQKVVDLAAAIARYTGKVNLHVINFTDIQMAIYETCPHDELTIIMRRYMMRIAEELAVRSKCNGLVTGESIAQVASQTMQSLMATDEVVTRMPVYRPVIAFDKQEIVDISLKIGTYDTSVLPYEDCCTIFVAKHPVTKPRVEPIRKSEHLLDGKIEALVEKAFETDEVIEVR